MLLIIINSHALLTSTSVSIRIKHISIVATASVRSKVVDASMLTRIGCVRTAFIDVCRISVQLNRHKVHHAFNSQHTVTCKSIAVESIPSTAAACIAAYCIMAVLTAPIDLHPAFINVCTKTNYEVVVVPFK